MFTPEYEEPRRLAASWYWHSRHIKLTGTSINVYYVIIYCLIFANFTETTSRFNKITPESTVSDLNTIEQQFWTGRPAFLTNPMENLWSIMVHRIYSENRQFQSPNELKDAILEAWKGISDDVINNLIQKVSNLIIRFISHFLYAIQQFLR